MNHIFYHFFNYGDCIERFTKTFKKIESSKLLESLETIFVNVTNDYMPLEKIISELTSLSPKIKIFNVSTDLSSESDTLKLMWDVCQTLNSNHNVLYLHSKGVSKPTNKNVASWIEYMEYFLIENWENCLKVLQTNDACGVNLQPIPMWHFSGNFWWAKNLFLQKTKRFDVKNSSYVSDIRSYCEMWLLDNQPNIPYCLHMSNINHYGDVYTPNKYKQL